jgi:hypothetical protein
MKRNRLIFAFLAIVFLAMESCSYTPTHCPLLLALVDQSGTPVKDIVCHLLKNGTETENKASDTDGKCSWDVVRGYDEAYTISSEFESQFTIRIDGGTAHESKTVAAVFASDSFIVTLQGI